MKTTAELHSRAQRVMDNADPQTADLLEDVWVTLQQREDASDVLNKLIDYWQGRAEKAENQLRKAENQIQAVYRVLPVNEELTEIENLLVEKVTYALAHPDEPEIGITDIDTILAVSSDKRSGIKTRLDVLLDKVDTQKLVEELVNSGWTVLPEGKARAKALTTVVSPRGTRTNIPASKEYVDYPRRLSEAVTAIAKDRAIS